MSCAAISQPQQQQSFRRRRPLQHNQHQHQDQQQQQLVSFFSAIQMGGALARVMGSVTSNTPNPADNPFALFCSAPPISTEAFGERLGKYFGCSATCFAVAAVYLSRVQITHPQLFDKIAIYKLLLVSVTVATKFCEDECCKQEHFAKCGGIELEELNRLENHFFLNLLSCNASVSTDDIRAATILLENTVIAKTNPPMHEQPQAQQVAQQPPPPQQQQKQQEQQQQQQLVQKEGVCRKRQTCEMEDEQPVSNRCLRPKTRYTRSSSSHMSV